MTESIDHRRLVMAGIKLIAARYPSMRIISDIQESPGDQVPFLIGNHRPDIYAADLSQGAKPSLVIAEAKTDMDLDSPHTESQVRSFIDFLEHRDQSKLILLTTGAGARRAKSILRFASVEASVRRSQLAVFDTLDLWHYNSKAKKWHLS